MDTLIDVTAEDIARGIRRDCDSCPLALAIVRRCKQGAFVAVGTDTVHFYPNRSVTGRLAKEVVRLPQSAADFRMCFDVHGPDQVRPFQFEMHIPEQFRK